MLVRGVGLAEFESNSGAGPLESPQHLNMHEKNDMKKGWQYFKFSIIGPNLVQELSDIRTAFLQQ